MVESVQKANEAEQKLALANEILRNHKKTNLERFVEVTRGLVMIAGGTLLVVKGAITAFSGVGTLAGLAEIYGGTVITVAGVKTIQGKLHIVEGPPKKE